VRLRCPAVVALQVLASACGAGWVYASNKYDCLNIGGCVGDVDLWITLGDAAFYLFCASWLALLAATGLHAWKTAGTWAKSAAWALGILAPMATVFATHWWFTNGITVASL